MAADLPFISVFCRLIKYSVFQAVRQILLLYIMIRKIMRIKISCPTPQLSGAFVMSVLQMCRDRSGLRISSINLVTTIMMSVLHLSRA